MTDSAAASAPAGFSARWLQQREAFDARARDAAAPTLGLQHLQAWRAQRLAGPAPATPALPPLRVLDLACGTGANLRWLAPRLGGAQQWLAVDHDAALLRAWPAALARAQAGPPLAGHLPAPGGARHGIGHPLVHAGPGFRAEIVRQQADLSQSLDALPWHAAHLVTASALLDLVGQPWLQAFVAAAARARVAVLVALTVDGRDNWGPAGMPAAGRATSPASPASPTQAQALAADDAHVAALFAAHQQRDKGLGGPALGPAAARALVRALRQAGYRVQAARSDWQLPGAGDPAAARLQRALIRGMAGAAIEQSPADAARVLAWRRQRLAAARRCTLSIGHLDVLGLPPD